MNKYELKGLVASAGTCEGTARVIREESDLEKLLPGEILIADYTIPDMLPAMRKSAAIITNQGGILSHGAVVSRELGIPCVVGTVCATERLKTGYQIRIEAERIGEGYVHYKPEIGRD